MTALAFAWAHRWGLAVAVLALACGILALTLRWALRRNRVQAQHAGPDVRAAVDGAVAAAKDAELAPTQAAQAARDKALATAAATPPPPVKPEVPAMSTADIGAEIARRAR